MSPAKRVRAVSDERVPKSFHGNAKKIGAQLRAVRADRGLTILELAAKAAVSAGMISQIERGNSNPSIKTLQRLGSALNVDIWEFLEGPKQPVAAGAAPFVRRREQRPQMVLGDTGLVKELLSPQYADSLRFMFVSMRPDSFTQHVLVGAGQKAGYIVYGTVELSVGEHSVTLEEGDSFQFNSDVHHQIANRSTEDAKVLWIMSAVDTRL